MDGTRWRAGWLSLALLVAVTGAAGCGQSKEPEEKKASLSIPGVGKIEATRSGDAGRITLKTEEGTVTLGTLPQVSEADLGVPIYPGAQQEEGGGFMAQGITQEEKAEGKWISAVFSTPDPFEKVAAFYKEKAGSEAHILDTSGGGHRNLTIVMGRQGKGGVTIAITRTPDEPKTVIHITRIDESS